jgi:hypothetical protein
MSRNWSRERWRKLYLRESAEQRGSWPLMARGVRDYLIRVAEDDGRVVSRGGAARLLDVLGAQPTAERELAAHAIALLLEDGFLVEGEDGAIYVSNLPKAQGDNDAAEDETTAPMTDAERAKKYRQRKKERDEALRNASRGGVTEPVRGVTSASRGLGQVDPSGSAVDSQNNQPKAEAERAPASAPVVTNGRDGERVTGRRDVTIEISMSLDWQPNRDTWGGFDVAMIPRAAAERLVLACKQHFVQKPEVQKTDREWNTVVIRWVNRDWNDAKKRPTLEGTDDSRLAASLPPLQRATPPRRDVLNGPAVPPPPGFGKLLKTVAK